MTYLLDRIMYLQAAFHREIDVSSGDEDCRLATVAIILCADSNYCTMGFMVKTNQVTVPFKSVAITDHLFSFDAY